jgi:hypothetical protein
MDEPVTSTRIIFSSVGCCCAIAGSTANAPNADNREYIMDFALIVANVTLLK